MSSQFQFLNCQSASRFWNNLLLPNRFPKSFFQSNIQHRFQHPIQQHWFRGWWLVAVIIFDWKYHFHRDRILRWFEFRMRLVLCCRFQVSFYQHRRGYHIGWRTTYRPIQWLDNNHRCHWWLVERVGHSSCSFKCLNMRNWLGLLQCITDRLPLGYRVNWQICRHQLVLLRDMILQHNNWW